jgi:hypothetical protein
MYRIYIEIKHWFRHDWYYYTDKFGPRVYQFRSCCYCHKLQKLTDNGWRDIVYYRKPEHP